MMIPRVFIQNIKSRLQQFPVVALIGPRQVGKTTLAKLIYKKKINNSVFLDLERPKDKMKLNDAEAYLEQHENQIVIIDEVQELPKLFSELRPIIDNKRKAGRFLLLGSASPHLVKGVSESLAGRISYFELFPILLNEAAKNKISLEIHWFRGGFPEPLLLKKDSEREDWYFNYLKSYCERDINHFFGVELSPRLIENFWTMIAAANGNLWSGENFARSLGVSSVTIKKYLQFLEAAFMVRVLHPWWSNTKKRLVKAPKVYIRDSGLLHYLNKINSYSDLFGNSIIGSSWEGYVIEQIKGNLPDGYNIYFYRTQNGAEVDLVISRANKPIASIEIKVNNAPIVSRGYYQAIEDLKTKFNYVIAPSSEKYPLNSSVTCISLIGFLNTELKKIIQ